MIYISDFGGASNFGDVLFLAGFEGTHGSTSFVDESSYARTLSSSGSPTITTTSPIVGTSGLNIPAGSLVSAPSSSDFAFAGEFTIEFWVRLAARSNFHTYDLVTFNGGSSGTIGWSVQYLSSSAVGNGLLRFVRSLDGTTISNLTTSSGVELEVNVNAHVCVERDASNVIRIYKDGVVGATSAASPGTLFNSTSPMIIGNGAVIDNPAGVFDEVRISSIAQYGGAFTPSTSPFPRS